MREGETSSLHASLVHCGTCQDATALDLAGHSPSARRGRCITKAGEAWGARCSTSRVRLYRVLARMEYRVRYAQAVVKQLEKMSPDVARRIRSKIDRLGNDLAGDVKRLTNFSPEYRLRV